MLDPRTIKPGIYDDMPFKDYLKIPAASASKLGAVKRSGAFCQLQQLTHETTDAQQIGTAVHTAVLEPHLLHNQFHRLPEDINLRTNEGKAQKEAILDRGIVPLKADDYDAVTGMAGSVRTHPLIKPMLESATGFEQTCVWQREAENGKPVLCKSRKDVTHPDWIADLKTTRDLFRFEREFVTHGYYRQAAWYMDGDIACGNNPKAFFFFVVQKTAPFESAIFSVDMLAMDTGREEAGQLFDQLNKHMKADDWPRHLPRIRRLSVPAWKVAEVFPEDDTEGGF